MRPGSVRRLCPDSEVRKHLQHALMRTSGFGALEGYAGRTDDHADGLLLEAGLVGFGDLVKPVELPINPRQYDLHDLAGLTNDLVAGFVPPLAGSVEDREPVRKAGRDLTIDEAAPFAFAHGDPVADLAAKHQLRDLGRLLAAPTIHQLCVGGAGQTRQKDRNGRCLKFPHRTYRNEWR